MLGTVRSQLTMQQENDKKLQEGFELGKKATTLDQQNRLDEAFSCYIGALDLLVPVLKSKEKKSCDFD